MGTARRAGGRSEADGGVRRWDESCSHFGEEGVGVCRAGIRLRLRGMERRGRETRDGREVAEVINNTSWRDRRPFGDPFCMWNARYA